MTENGSVVFEYEYLMAYAATAGEFPASAKAAPGVLALQRALIWLAGASVAIVFIEPSPYEVVTLSAILVFFATGLRLRLLFMPLLLGVPFGTGVSASPGGVLGLEPGSVLCEAPGAVI